MNAKLAIFSVAFVLQAALGYAEESFYGSFYFTSKTPDTLYLLGKIEESDDFELRSALRDHKIETVALASRGGSVLGGLAIAGIVGDRKLRTIIPGGALCASACAYIFLAGSERSANGSLGVHQFASVQGDKEETIGRVQADTQAITSEILGFLREFNTPAFVAEYMFRSREMYWFDEIQIDQLNSTEFTLAPYKQAAIYLVIKGLIDEAERQETLEKKQNGPPKDEPNVEIGTPRLEDDADTKLKKYIGAVQRRLNVLNCNAGGADGVLGRNTRNALKRFSRNAGVRYYDDILFDKKFIEKLMSTPDIKCPAITRKTTPTAKSLPLKLAKHWKITCSNNNGKILHTLFARVDHYNNRTGDISLSVQTSQGAENSAHGSINNRRITLYNGTGYFNSNYTSFSLSDPDCPKSLRFTALY